MGLTNLSDSTQDYLKAIWNITEWSDKPATNKAIAERLGVRLSSVSDALKRLTQAGLVEHTRYKSVELTEEGRRYAVPW